MLAEKPFYPSTRINVLFLLVVTISQAALSQAINACAEIKYCTCGTGDKETEGAAKGDKVEEPCPIHADKVDPSNLTADKDT